VSGGDCGRYARAVAALQARGRFGIRLGLGRTRALLRALGDPHQALPGALVAGTNGKGSVQAMVAAVLANAGYRVGQTPSPHLVTYRERITVAGEPIAPADFAMAVEDVLVREERIARRLGHATEFELLVAAAFAWFARAHVQVGVVEVGIGGRLDATNTWDGGVAAITNVGWDHADRLGATLTAIAREKAAIIKRGDRAVTGATGPGLAVIRGRAHRMGVPLLETAPLPVRSMDRGGLWVEENRLGRLRVPLLGRHQAANAAVALGILAQLEAIGAAHVPEAALRAGLADVHWPGRLELLAVDGTGSARPAPARAPDPECPDVLLDGAHNVSGMESLVAAFDELRPLLSPGRPTLLLALMADKDVAGILERLSRSAWLVPARIITTRIFSARALPAADLAAACRELLSHAHGEPPEIVALEPVESALEEALKTSRREGGPLVVAGSLYLAGEVRGRLVHEPRLRDPAVQ
jgi:dihydrofolate synthase/folylpolyglutamate synthase